MTEREDAIEQIARYRSTIDDLDARIVELLNARADQSLAIRALKPAAGMKRVYDPEREERIMARLGELTDGPLRPEDIRAIYQPLLETMRALPTPGAPAREPMSGAAGQ